LLIFVWKQPANTKAESKRRAYEKNSYQLRRVDKRRPCKQFVKLRHHFLLNFRFSPSRHTTSIIERSQSGSMAHNQFEKHHSNYSPLLLTASIIIVSPLFLYLI